MNKYFNTLTNTRGDSLPGFRAQVVDSLGDIVSIYQDRSLTPFTDGDGNTVNYVTADLDGIVEFFWEAAEGQILQTLDTAGDLVKAIDGFADNFVLDNLGGTLGQSSVNGLPAALAARPTFTELADTTGAGLIGTTSGDTVQEVLDAIGGDEHYWEGLAWLTPFRKRVIDGSGNNTVLTGDSTTFGQYVAAGYKPDQHLRQLARAHGAFYQVFFNRGQSGQDTTSWLSTYLAGDITNGGNTPHLIIARWGANDPAVSGNTAAQAAANYETAIDTIRASLGLTACGILIMTPGPMFDTPGGRNAAYFEELAGLLRTVARDKKCAFFDSYQYLKDGDGLAGTTYDDPFADGREIHPNEAVISLMYDEVARVLFGGLGAAKKNHFWNLGSFDRTLLPTAGAADFDFGLFCDRAVNTDGWDRNGYALTLRPVDGTTAMQFNWGFADGNPTVLMRLYQGGSWLAWQTLATQAPLTQATTVAQSGTPVATSVGYLGSPQIADQDDYTLALNDAGGHYYHVSGSTHTLTIPANASVAFPVGTVIGIVNESGAGNITLAITSDTLRWGSSTGSRTIAANGSATLLKVSSTVWRLTGDGIT